MCAFSTNSDDAVVLTVSNLVQAYHVQTYGLQINGLKTGPAAISSYINGLDSTGAYVEIYEGARKILTKIIPDFQWQQIQTSRVALNLNPSQNNVKSALTVQFTLSQPIPAQGSVTVVLPKQNYQYANLGRIFAMEMIQQVNELGPSSYSIYSGSRTASSPTVTVQATDNLQIVKVKLGNSNPIVAGSSLYVTLQNVLTPPSLAPMTEIQAYTGDENFNQIEVSAPNVLSLTNQSPGDDISSGGRSNIQIQSAAGVLESNAKYQFEFFLAGDIPRDGYYTLTVPTDVGVPSNMPGGLTFQCISNCDHNSIILTWSAATRTLSFDGAMNNRQLIQAPGPIVFTLTGFTNPSTADPAYFTFTTYAKIDGRFYMIDRLSKVGVEAQQGKCTVSQFYPTDGNYQIYGLARNWTVSMFCEHEFDPSYSLRITLPKPWLAVTTSRCIMENGAYNRSMEYDKNWVETFQRSYNYKQDFNWDRLYCNTRSHCLTRRNCLNSYYCLNKVYAQHHEITWSTNMATTYSCFGDSSTNQILISPAFGEKIAPKTRFTFIIDSIRNPTEFDPWTYSRYEIKFEVLSPKNGAVDVGTYAIWKKWFEQGEIWQFTVEPESYGVGDYPVYYKFTYQPSGEIPANAHMHLTLPPEIQIKDEMALEKWCTYNTSGFIDPAIQFTKNFYQYEVRLNCQLRGNKIIIKDGFRRGGTNNMVIRDLMIPPTISFTLPQFWNARTMQTTGAFNISICFDGDETLPLYRWNSSLAPTVNGYNSSAVRQGPAVQMLYAAKPKYFNYNKGSDANGAVNDYEFVVKPQNVMKEGDKIVIELPSPAFFSEDSKVIGISSNLRPDQKSKVSVGLNEIQIDLQLPISMSRLLQAGSAMEIDAGVAFQFNITGVKNPPSTKPTLGSITYSSYNDGALIEQLDEGFSITNSKPGIVPEAEASILPDQWEPSTAANYTLIYNPQNYQQNMYMTLTLPKQIDFSENAIRCFGAAGTDQDKQELDCQIDKAERTITIRNFVEFLPGNPGKIEILFQTLVNPMYNVLTDSFILRTYTVDDYILDEMSEKLAVNFFCEFPCATCHNTWTDECYSCYGSSKFAIYHESQCWDKCPDGFTSLNTTNCTACAEPCATCSEESKTECLSCLEGYQLRGSQCVEIVRWPFPYIIIGVIQFALILCSEVVTKTESRFKEAFIAFLSLPELWSWFTFLSLHFARKGAGGAFALALVAILLYGVLNFIHAVIHPRQIIPNSTASYKAVNSNYFIHSFCIKTTSYCCSFKYSLLMVSYFFMKPQYKGDYSALNWKQFNRFSLAFILLPYPIMMTACCYFLADDGLFSYAGFSAIECIIISSIMASLMLLDAISAIKFQPKKNSFNPRSLTDANGNRIALDQEYESEDDLRFGKLRKKGQFRAKNFEYGADEQSSMNLSERNMLSQQKLMRPETADDATRIQREVQQVIDTYAAKPGLDEFTLKQIAMLEELARQMREEKEQLRLEKERIERERQAMILDQQQIRLQNFFERGMEEDQPTNVNDIQVKEYSDSGLATNYDRVTSYDKNTHYDRVTEMRNFDRTERTTHMRNLNQEDLLEQQENEIELRHQKSSLSHHQRKSMQRSLLKGSIKDYRDIEGEEMYDYDQFEIDGQSQLTDDFFEGAQMPMPVYGQIKYQRELEGEFEEYLRLLTPRAGGDSLINEEQDEMYAKEIALSGRATPAYELGTDQQSRIGQPEDFVNRSNAGYSFQKTINFKDESEIYQQRSEAQNEEDSPRSQRSANVNFLNLESVVRSQASEIPSLVGNEYIVNNNSAAMGLESPRSSKEATPREYFQNEMGEMGTTQTGYFQPSYNIPDEKFVNRDEEEKAFGDNTYDHQEVRQREGTPQQYFDQNLPSRGAASTFARSVIASELDFTKQEPPTTKRFQSQMSRREAGSRGTQGEDILSPDENSDYSPGVKKGRAFYDKDGNLVNQGQNDYDPQINKKARKETENQRSVRLSQNFMEDPNEPLNYTNLPAQFSREQTRRAQLSTVEHNLASQTQQESSSHGLTENRSLHQSLQPAPQVYEDQSGRDESSEGIVDHNPFASAAAIQGSQKGTELILNAVGKNLQKRFEQTKKQIIYSDKSESSCNEEMMGDTPSNYNVLNGRFDGKSLGLKQMVQNNTLPNVQEEQLQQNVASENKNSSQMSEQTEKRFVSNLRQGRTNGASLVQREQNQISNSEQASEKRRPKLKK